MKTLRSDCPIGSTLDIIGDKWTLLIIRDIMLRNKVSFSEFLESEEKISTNILADRLSNLEKENIVSKAVSQLNKSKNIYFLTKKGVALAPILIEMMDWGATYNDNCPRRTLGKKIQEDKSKAVKDLLEELTIKFNIS